MDDRLRVMEKLTAQIQPTFEAMVSAIEKYKDEDFNKIPFEGSWTGGQVCEHVKLSIEGMPELFQGKTEASNREPDEKVAMVAGVFLDFDKKYDSPEFIIPKQKSYDQNQFADFFSEYGKNLEELAAKLNMAKICLDFEIPGFGHDATRISFFRAFSHATAYAPTRQHKEGFTKSVTTASPQLCNRQNDLENPWTRPLSGQGKSSHSAFREGTKPASHKLS